MKEQEAAFISKITASVTHEFMNVLATIKETSGLMEDLLVMSVDDSFPHHEEFSKTLNTIQEQIKRGMEISGMLNKFAHSMEELQARVELNELLDQLSILMRRFAMLKRVKLAVNPHESPLYIRINPFLLQMILVACLEYCFDRTASGGVVTLQSFKTKKGISIQCLMEPCSSPDENAQELPNELMGFQETLHNINTQLFPINRTGQQGLELHLHSKTI
ncbi:sensor histidine kinase [Thermodesulfobacteriota bacterium]